MGTQGHAAHGKLVLVWQEAGTRAHSVTLLTPALLARHLVVVPWSRVCSSVSPLLPAGSPWPAGSPLGGQSLQRFLLSHFSQLELRSASHRYCYCLEGLPCASSHIKGLENGDSGVLRTFQHSLSGSITWCPSSPGSQTDQRPRCFLSKP